MGLSNSQPVCQLPKFSTHDVIVTIGCEATAAVAAVIVVSLSLQAKFHGSSFLVTSS